MRAKVDFSLHIIQVRRHWSNIFKVLKGRKRSTYYSASSENSFQKLRSNKDICRHRKTERMYYWQIYTTRNDKGNPSNRRQVIPEGNYIYIEEWEKKWKW